MSRSRAFVVVTNNYTFENMLEFVELPAQYIVYGFEIGDSGTPHLQGYVYFDNAKTIKSVSKYFPRSHIEIAKGTPQQNFDYDSKDGEYYEFGTIPSQGRATFDKVAEAMANPRDNFHLFHQYRKAYRELVGSEIKDHERRLIPVEKTRLLQVLRLTDIHPANLCYSDETYNGEEYMIVDYLRYGSTAIDISMWLEGYPQNIKRGYELIRIDPRVVYLVYQDERDRIEIDRKYFLDDE